MYCKNCGTELTDDSKFCYKCGVATDLNLEKKGKKRTKDIELTNEIQELKKLIEQGLQNVFQLGVDQEIIEKLKKTVDSRKTGELLIKNYQILSKTDLIDDLKRLSTNYDNIKAYLARFIEFEIVDNVFPHKIKNPNKSHLADKVSSLKYTNTPFEKNEKQETKGTKFSGCLIIIGAIILVGIIISVLSPDDEKPIINSDDITNGQMTEGSKTEDIEDDDPNCLKYLIVQDTYGAVTEDNLEKIIRYAQRNEINLIERMLNRGDAVLLKTGTTVFVLDAGFAVHQIRVVNTEIELYVVRESIKKRKCDN